MGLRWRKREVSAPTDAELECAQERLTQARRVRKTQERKRDQEKEIGVVADRLAQSNHLGALVWDVVTGQPPPWAREERS